MMTVHSIDYLDLDVEALECLYSFAKFPFDFNNQCASTELRMLCEIYIHM